MTESNNADSLTILIDLIAQRYPFTSGHYPFLAALLGEQAAQVFGINHNLQHMMKDLGALAAECENFDHSGTMNYDNLRKSTAKMLINSLRLAELVGFDGPSLATAVLDIMNKK